MSSNYIEEEATQEGEQESASGRNDLDRLWLDVTSTRYRSIGGNWCSEGLKYCDLIFTKLNITCMRCQLDLVLQEVFSHKSKDN